MHRLVIFQRRKLLPSLMVSAVISILLASAVGDADAARRNYYAFVPIKTLDFDVALSYGKKWGDRAKGETFRQSYTLRLSGFAVDPRLLSYRLSLGTGIQDNEGYFRDDTWLVNSEVTLSFFNNINRYKGLKLWKYVPSPVSVSYGYTVSDDYRFEVYGLNMYYARSGYVRFFSNGKLIYFDDGRKKNRNDTNRYRLKYEDETFNYNRNGNGNWNRNGNGNWNRNGNNNWGNNGDWNNETPGTALGLQKEPKTPLGFTFPTMSFNMSHGEWESKILSGLDYVYTMGSLRFDVSNHVDKKGSRGYGSVYRLAHNFYRSEQRGDRDHTILTTSNAWGNFKMWNKLERRVTDQSTYLRYVLDTNYANYYKNLSYSFALGGMYEEEDDYTAYEYGGSVIAATSLYSKRRLTPNLLSVTRMSMGIGRERDRVVDGIHYEGRELYNVGVTEKLDYVRFKRFDIETEVTASVSESGVPFTVTLMGKTKRLRKWNYDMQYRYITVYPRAYGERTSSESAETGLAYAFTTDLRMEHRAGWNHEIESGGEKTGTDSIYYKGSGIWRISPRSSSDVTFKLTSNDIMDLYQILFHYRTAVNTRGHLNLVYQTDWESGAEGRNDILLARYGWNYRRFALSFEYDYDSNKGNAVEHTLWLKLKRNFAGRLGRMM